MTINFDDSMLSGIPKLDEDHKKIITALNSAVSEAEKNNDRNKMQRLADLFLTYMTHHFVEEEALMEEVGYPVEEITAHKFAHQVIQETYLVCLRNLVSGNTALAESLTILDYSFSNHLLTEDKKMIEFMQSVIPPAAQ